MALPGGWADQKGEIGRYVEDKARECLAVYERSPARIREDVGTERAITEGGYGHRQLFELIQNGADAILGALTGEESANAQRIEVVLTRSALYVANEGTPVDRPGVEAILHSHISNKRGAEIGHFGLGFKSVLAITQRPQFFSRTGSFGFDVTDAGRLIRQAASRAENPPGVDAIEDTPGLRIARPLNPLDEARQDHWLRELMTWATTVVKLPRDGHRAGGLGQDIESFPAQFLLFSPHVRILNLVDEEAGTRRELRAVELDDGRIQLSDKGDISEWRVFRTDHEPTPEARFDGGTIAGRGSVAVAWAVPLLDRRAERGRFWAFFPTTYETTLSGVVNAPWKTNADRQGLLEGVYNRELLDVVAGLVAANLRALLNPEEPGDLLDKLPARDTLQWTDEALAEKVYTALAGTECLPDSDGTLRQPNSLQVLPAGLNEESLAAWSVLEGRPAGWADVSVGTRDRRSRAVRLGARESSAVQWLESIVAPAEPADSVAALTVGATLLPERGPVPGNSPVRQARIVLTAKGQLVSEAATHLLLNTEFSSESTDLSLVHPQVQEDETARSVLVRLGLAGADAFDELKRITPPGRGTTWERYWTVLRWVDLTIPEVVTFLSAHRFQIKIRTLSGEFQPVYAVLLPGEIVPGDGSRDAQLTVDVGYHKEELAAITIPLRLVASPRANQFARVEPVCTTIESEVRAEYFADIPAGSRPQADRVCFDRNLTAAGPLTPLVSNLSDEGKVLFTAALLPLAAQDQPWTMAHDSPQQRPKYPERPCHAPSQLVAVRFGLMSSTLGVRPLSECVDSELSRWSQLLPVVEAPPFCGLAQRLDDLSAEQSSSALDQALEVDDPLLLGAFYGKLAKFVGPPDRVRCGFGNSHDELPPSQVVVTHHRWVYDALLNDGSGALFAESDQEARLLRERWGMLESEADASKTVRYAGAESAVPFADLFPGLPHALLDERGDVECVPCAEVWREYLTLSGVVRARAPALLGEDGRLYYDQSLEPSAALEALLFVQGVEVDDEGKSLALVETARAEQRDRLAAVQSAVSLEEKLVAALGEGPLLQALPSHVMQAAREYHDPLAARQLASLVLAVHGVSALRILGRGLADAGLKPPLRWGGTARALSFVRDLGFPDVYAGTPSSEVPPWLDIEGPIKLNPLHAFQETVASRLIDFCRERPPGRGLVSLPTGAGKTRVVAESLVRAFATGELRGTVLWIADRQELCDQAVQTWKDVWRAAGPRRSLRISRLWGNNNRKVVDRPGQPHLVVATYQSLRSRLGAQYSWIGEAEVIVIDEAHGSTSPSYTQILSSLGLDARTTTRPLIGLSATPFRGRLEDTEETQRLVARYDKRRFDFGVFADDDPYPELRRLKVLSEVGWKVLPGVDLALSRSEMAHLDQYKVLPSSVEGRLGLNADRNDAIVTALDGCPDDWPILLFATSVDQAELLAGLLCLREIPARAISGQTPDDVRRNAIEGFRSGELRVLTNYNVLTTGFDAPETRAIFVTRPVYSPGLYLQMIGRGLRGPLNGGTDECLIVNVEDNVLAYGEELAFRNFEHLWR